MLACLLTCMLGCSLPGMRTTVMLNVDSALGDAVGGVFLGRDAYMLGQQKKFTPM